MWVAASPSRLYRCKIARGRTLSTMRFPQVGWVRNIVVALLGSDQGPAPVYYPLLYKKEDFSPPPCPQPILIWGILVSTEIANTLFKSPKLWARETSNRARSDCPAAPAWKEFSSPWVQMSFEFVIPLLCLCIIRVGEIPAYPVLLTCMAAFMKSPLFKNTRTCPMHMVGLSSFKMFCFLL